MSSLYVRLRSWLALDEGPSLEAVGQRFVALDLETTGLDPRRDAIVSLAAIPFQGGRPAPGYVTLVDPERPIPPASTAVHGLTDRLVRGAPRVDHVLPAIEPVVGDALLVGHNIDFDVALLARVRRARGLPRLRNRVADTRRLGRALHPEWRDVSLERLASRLGVEVVARHTAEGDALTAGRIFLALLPELRARRIQTVAELVWFQGRAMSH
jgi:DNA polymerase III epsilon subunit family exonuclease